MRTTAGNPGGAAPAGRPPPPPRAIRGQHRPSPIFQPRPPLTRGASAHLTTRTWMQAEATPAVTGHMRNERTQNWRTTRGGGRPHGQRLARDRWPPGARRAESRVTAGNESRTWPRCARLSRPARRSSLLFPGWPAAADGAALDLHRDLGRRLAARFQAPVPGAWSAQGEPHPSASGCGWSNERTRLWSVVAVGEKIERDGAVRV
jgi:hypothetical protein